jgi:hypothetical protein
LAALTNVCAVITSTVAIRFTLSQAFRSKSPQALNQNARAAILVRSGSGFGETAERAQRTEYSGE